jgi:hypothetical protein
MWRLYVLSRLTKVYYYSTSHRNLDTRAEICSDLCNVFGTLHGACAAYIVDMYVFTCNFTTTVTSPTPAVALLHRSFYWAPFWGSTEPVFLNL